MSDDATRKLSVEGVDLLSLAGVNDGNLVELTRRLGVRVALRVGVPEGVRACWQRGQAGAGRG